MELIRTTSYAKALKRLSKLGASDAHIQAMENAIAFAPDVGEVIPGLGGLRKIRFGYSNTGKSGGGRTIYFVKTEAERIYLIFAYAKADMGDLTPEQKKVFSKLAKELENG
jgi:hypothetical protein